MKNLLSIDKELLVYLHEQASASARLRMNYDLRTTTADTSQRMLNALLPNTKVPIHRHEKTSETVICLTGKLEEIFYEETESGQEFKEAHRYLISPAEGKYGIQIPAGVWHSINVLEPSVIFEAKDGAYMP